MSATSTRATLVAIFIGSLALQSVVFFVLVGQHALSWQEAWPLFKTLMIAYSVPLTIILGGIFAERALPKRQPPAFAFWIALVVSSLWNLLLVVPTTMYFFRQNAVPEFVEVALNNSGSFNFLVAGALTYFFVGRK